MENFEIEGSGGCPLRIRHYPGKGSELLIIVHGFKGFADWGFFPYMAEKFSSFLPQVLLFDFSHNGVFETPGEFTRLDLFEKNTYGREIFDLSTVIDWGRKKFSPTKIFLLGHSRGGGISILTAEKMKVQGVITLASVDRVLRFDAATLKIWKETGRLIMKNSRTGQEMPMALDILKEVEENPDQFDILKHAARLKIPCLHFHAKDDMAVDASALENLVAQTGGEKVLFSSGGHTFGVRHPFEGTTEELDQILKKSCAFIAENPIAS
jgi:pimeloyl-ACP methyl ester carboxylesterase